MSEQPPEFEPTPEYIPSAEEVTLIFERLVDGKEYKVARQLEDEKGLRLLEIIISNEDGVGYREYEYSRGPLRPKEGEPKIKPYIHVANYSDDSGIPDGGYSVAKYIDGEWKLTP